MKKLMFAAVAMSVGAAIAVESANVVGYTSNAGDWFVSAATAFTPIDAASWTCAGDVLGNDIAAYDTVSVFNPDTWDFDIYQFKGFDGSGHSLGWEKSEADLDAQLINPDADPIYTDVASFTVTKGSVLYYQPVDGVSGLTVAGQVDDITQSSTVTYSGSWFYELVNPFPVATTLSDLATFFQPYDTLSVFNPNTWDFDIYMYNGGGSWEKSEADLDAQILNPDADPIYTVITDGTTTVLEAGKGGYYQPSDDADRVWTVTL